MNSAAARGRILIKAEPETNPISGCRQNAHSTSPQEQMQMCVYAAAVKAKAAPISHF